MNDVEATDNDAGTPRPSRRAPSMGTMNALVVGILVILCAGALKLTAPVTMPLAFSLFIVVLYEPLLGLLKRHMPRWAAALITFQAVLASMVAIMASLWLCATMVSAKAPKYREGFAKAGDTLAEWGAAVGLSDQLGQGQTGQYLDALGSAAGGIAQSVANAAGGLVLVVTFAMLAMSEAGAWKRKVRAQWGDHSLTTASTIASRCRSYVLTRTMTSVLTGVLTGLLTWAVGLDLAFVWAVIAILLNYIPTLGSIIAIIPPTLLAYVQLGGPGALGVFAGLTVLQILIGNYLDPKLQGRSLQLSPFVLLFSIGLWGWVWGIGGALLAVPLTMTATVICSQFPQSRWIATLLAEDVADVEMASEAPPRRHDDNEQRSRAA